MARGGNRPGAGRPKLPETKRQAQRRQTQVQREQEALTKEAAREFTRQTITAALGPMLRAQIAHATGIGHLYQRDHGKFTKVESEEAILDALTNGVEGRDYWIFPKDPSTQAFAALSAYALDKPKEQAQEITLTGEVTLVEKVRQLRARQGRAAA